MDDDNNGIDGCRLDDDLDDPAIRVTLQLLRRYDPIHDEGRRENSRSEVQRTLTGCRLRESFSGHRLLYLWVRFDDDNIDPDSCE